MNASTQPNVWLRAMLGAATGSVTGYFAFFLLASQSFYALALPGACLGLSAGWLSGRRSVAIGVCCGLLALCLGGFTEWRFAPFVKDGSLAYFIAHVHQLKPVTLIMITVGGLFGFWFGMGRDRVVVNREIPHSHD